MMIAQKPRGHIIVPIDDYYLNMVLKVGPTVSRPFKPIYVELYDLVESAEGQSHCFKTTVMEASRITEAHGHTIAGQWLLRASTGLLSLVKTHDAPLRNFLIDATSSAIARSRYENFYK